MNGNDVMVSFRNSTIRICNHNYTQCYFYSKEAMAIVSFMRYITRDGQIM